MGSSGSGGREWTTVYHTKEESREGCDLDLLNVASLHQLTQKFFFFKFRLYKNTKRVHYQVILKFVSCTPPPSPCPFFVSVTCLERMLGFFGHHF